jgi:hypothetical protein
MRQVMTEPARNLLVTICCVALDLVSLTFSAMRSRARLAAENLFLRKQLALYVERQAKPRRSNNATRITLVTLSRFLEWRQLLTIVKPETLIRLAPKGIPAVLALEIAWARSAAGSSGRSAADRDDGGGESDLGRGTDCCGAPRQARHSPLSADCSTVHAAATATREAGNSGVEHVCAEPRAIGARQRFLYRRNGHISRDVRVHRAGSIHDESCIGT